MSRIDASSFRPPGRVFQSTALKIGYLSTILSLLAVARGEMKTF